jgi:hypothetical protein
MLPVYPWIGGFDFTAKPSAFGNDRFPSKQKKPLRDKYLTDSIEVIS